MTVNCEHRIPSPGAPLQKRPADELLMRQVRQAASGGILYDALRCDQSFGSHRFLLRHVQHGPRQSLSRWLHRTVPHRRSPTVHFAVHIVVQCIRSVKTEDSCVRLLPFGHPIRSKPWSGRSGLISSDLARSDLLVSVITRLGSHLTLY